MTKTTPTDIEPTATTLPSPHVDHSSVFVNELDARLMGFDSGIMALETEITGMTIAYDQEVAERAQKHADAVAQKRRQLVDMNRGRRMAMAGKDAYAAEIPEEGE